jgi:hypothetical protein
MPFLERKSGSKYPERWAPGEPGEGFDGAGRNSKRLKSTLQKDKKEPKSEREPEKSTKRTTVKDKKESRKDRKDDRGDRKEDRYVT